jgi:protein O-mannosyl-transferase
MAKKKKKFSVSEASNSPKPPQPKTTTAGSPKILKTAGLILVFIAFLVYSNTLNHKYVLDDFSVIKENTMTQKGVSAIPEILTSTYRAGTGNDESGLYRPLSKIMFAIEWDISEDNPALSHWVNVLLYAFTAWLLFLVLHKFLKGNLIIPFLTTLIFVVHPIHTEVVANIKSRDEILSFLFLLGALWCIYRYMKSEDMKFALLSGLCFFLSLLSKESSITYLAVFPLAIWFFFKDPKKKLIRISIIMAGVTALYLIIHYSVVGGFSPSLGRVPVVDNSLMATDNVAHQKATAIYILGLYLKLLIFPHPLSCDYSYNTIPIITSFGNPWFLLSLGVHLFLLIFALKKFKEKSLLSFCILFYFITMSIASNLFTIIGTNMADRLLYAPSLGFALAVVVLLSRLFKTEDNSYYSGISDFFQQNSKIAGVVGLLCLPFFAKTWSRNQDWETVKTLFNNDIKIVPNSAHMLFYHANMITNKDSLAVMNPQTKEATLKLALDELTKALSIWEQFPDAHNQVGKIYFEIKNYEMAAVAYKRAMELNANNATYYNNYGTCLFSTGKIVESEFYFKKAIELNPEYNDALCNLGSVYGTVGENLKAQGKVEEANKEFEKAIYYFKKTIEVDKNYALAYKFIAATYQNMGRNEEAQPWFTKFNQVEAAKKGK